MVIRCDTRKVDEYVAQIVSQMTDNLSLIDFEVQSQCRLNFRILQKACRRL